MKHGTRSNIKGVDTVLKNLNKEINEMKENITMKGLIEAVIIIRRSMDLETPKIPVRTGNLRSSFFTVTVKGREKINSGEGSFKGDDASKLSQDYGSAINNAVAIVSAARKPMAMFGFSAYYAAAVHETDKKYRRPGSGAKFLENALDRNHKEIIDAIAKAGRIT